MPRPTLAQLQQRGFALEDEVLIRHGKYAAAATGLTTLALSRIVPSGQSMGKRLRNVVTTPAKKYKTTTASIVKRAVKAAHELKNYDVSLTNAGNGVLMTSVLLNPISQGSTAVQRTGRDVIIENVQISGFMQASAVNSADYIRTMLVWDKECRGAAFVAADLFEVATNNESATSPIKFDNIHRFKILADKKWVVESKTATQSGLTKFTLNHKVGLKTHYYNTSAGTIADIDSGSLYWVVCCANGASLTDCYAARTTFRDV